MQTYCSIAKSACSSRKIGVMLSRRISKLRWQFVTRRAKLGVTVIAGRLGVFAKTEATSKVQNHQYGDGVLEGTFFPGTGSSLPCYCLMPLSAWRAFLWTLPTLFSSLPSKVGSLINFPNSSFVLRFTS